MRLAIPRLPGNESNVESTRANSPLRSDKKGLIGITEPRRVAALSMAKRVALELNLPGPDENVRYDVLTRVTLLTVA